MVDDLLCEFKIAYGSFAFRIVKENGLAEAWGFGKADIPGYYGGKDLIAEEVLQIVADLVGEVRPVIVHGQENSLNRQAGIVGTSNANQGIEEFGDALKREVLALHGDDDGISGHKRVEGKEVKGRRAVEEDVVKFVAKFVHPLAQGLFTVRAIHEFDGCSDEVLIGGDEVKPLDPALQGEVGERHIKHE
jgi:hypothetical protein